MTPFKKSRLVLPKAAYKALCDAIHRRDRWRCRSCGYRNNLHSHHIVFRSQQGDDADWNMITLCDPCHMQGVHARNLLIVAGTGNIDDPIDANKPVRFVRLNEWKPR